MLIKVCPHCKGDGFWRKNPAEVHPMANIANASNIYENGRRFPACDAPAYYSSRLVAMEFPCFKCSGTGELQWNRGKSLTP